VRQQRPSVSSELVGSGVQAEALRSIGSGSLGALLQVGGAYDQPARGVLGLTHAAADRDGVSRSVVKH
jgi:hypothetical protein